MKTKKYLKVTVTRFNNETFENPLRLSEVNLINKLVKENKAVNIVLTECTESWYKLIFG
jgi:hypothetical protein